MEKRRPHHSLEEIKKQFASAGNLNRSYVSRQGADSLEIDDEDIVRIIQGLSQKDFEKSMTSMASSRVWQDVYRPAWGSIALYVKFTIDAMGNYYLISFKEA